MLDDDGRELPPGQTGALYARHVATPTSPTATTTRRARARKQRGLWTLGDVGYLDDEGFLFIVDRQSDMVISGGVNIYPAEIESVLMTMPGVADCALFGIPDAEFGESLAAVQPAPDAALTARTMRAFLHERIAGYKVPRVVTFHEALPREDSSKIFKQRLRDPYWRGGAEGEGPPRSANDRDRYTSPADGKGLSG